MILHKTKMISALVFILLALPVLPLHAYAVVSQSADRLNDRYALFTLTYRLGFLNRETYVPFTAFYGASTSPDHAGFTFVSASGSPAKVVAAVGAVLSDAPLKNRQYYIPQGSNQDFTMIGLVELPQRYEPTALSISNLPFTLVSDGKAVRAGLRNKDLDTFHTELLP